MDAMLGNRRNVLTAMLMKLSLRGSNRPVVAVQVFMGPRFIIEIKQLLLIRHDKV